MKRIKSLPTVFGLIFVLIGIFAGVFLIGQVRHWQLKAAGEVGPKQIEITNITDKSFSLSWITDTLSVGAVKYGESEGNLIQTAKDDRDKFSSQIGSFPTHHVTVGGETTELKPNSQYFFKIESAGKLFGHPETTRAFTVTTAPSIGQPPPNDVAYGTITDQNNTPVEGVIVYLSLTNTIRQSTLTKTSGSWVIPLNLARSNDLLSYANYDYEASIEEILAQAALLGTATAVTTTKNDSPVPNITLGQTYDFRQPQTAAPAEPTTAPENQSEGFNIEEMPSNQTGNQDLTIINPGQGENINTAKPQISGTGPASETIIITLESPETITDQVVVKSDGTWSWIPPADLAPGAHTITAILANGTKISQMFTVLAAEESDLPSFTATPSATPTTTLRATPTPVGRTSLPSTEAGIPTSGYLTPTLTTSIMGIALIVLGILSNILLQKPF